MGSFEDIKALTPAWPLRPMQPWDKQAGNPRSRQDHSAAPHKLVPQQHDVESEDDAPHIDEYA
jgi:hypothetical protein